METSVKFVALAAMLCIAGAAIPASAQTNTVTQTQQGNTYVGYSTGTRACPSVHWTLVRQYAPNAQSGPLSGIVFYNNGSGVSRMKGESQPDGSFNLNLASIDGKGPVGVINGVRKPDGSLTADFASASGDCKYSMPVVPMGPEFGAGGSE